MNIAFVGIRENSKKTKSAPKRIANILYEKLLLLNDNTYFYSLTYENETNFKKQSNKEFFGNLLGLKRFIKEKRIDVVYFARYYSKVAIALVALKKILRFKLVYTVHGIVKKEHSINKTFSKNSVWIEELLLRNCDSIVCVSEDSVSELRSFYPNLKIEKIKIINNAVEIPKEYKKIDIYKSFNLIPEKKLILTVGTRKMKNTHLILEAFSTDKELMNKSQLLVVGDYKDDYSKDLVEKYENFSSIKFIDYVDPDILYNIYNATDLYVQLSQFETFGISLIEALLFGSTVIVNENLPIANYFKDTEVVLYNLNSNKLGTLMAECLEEKDSSSKVAINKAKDNFNWEKITERYYKVFQDNISTVED